MKRWIAALTAALALAGVGLSSATSTAATAAACCRLPRYGPGATYHPLIRPAAFSPHITNPWFPLLAGTTYVYTGRKDGKRAVDVVEVSARTKVVGGVRTRIVNDRLYLDGVLEERTSDYYAQDRCGNVWYFGEDTAELDRSGHVIDRSGSFHAGVDGAQPGVYMQADPQIGRRFRQEWYRGEAEDTYRALSTNASVRVPFGSFGRALRTEETTALEPGVVDNKYYVRGVGVVKELTVKGGDEELVLVDVLR
jgi:hypothetical protein